MKRTLFILSAMLFVIGGCSKVNVPVDDSSNSSYWVSDSNNIIGIDQVKSYIARTRPNTKSNKDLDYRITPYGGSADDPLLYIVNYGDSEGWQILSSDSRVPAVVAHGETGYFSLEEGSPAVRVWLDCMATDMANIRCAPDKDLAFSAEEIAAHKSVWGEEPGRVIVPGDENGHWEVITTYEWIPGETVLHMTPHWDQMHPYNTYCPLRSDTTSVRVPAGCVAIAAAEVLYYLHNHLGVPATMVDDGYCIGDVTDFEQDFSGNSSTVWSLMSPESQYYSADAEALMIGHVGKVIGMNYGNSASWTFPSRISSQLFSLYSITSSSGDYDANSVKSDLGHYLPVIVTASDWSIPINGDIHTFVIDGFQKTYKRYTHYHYWVEDDPWNPKHLPFNHDPYYTFTYTTPEITSIKINWGWWTQWTTPPVNDGWYSLTPNWTVTNGSTYNYNHNVSMIYNIGVAE